MFHAETKKPRYTKFTGQVPAQFYDEQYFTGDGKSNWDEPYALDNFYKLFRQWAIFLITGFPEATSFLDVGCARGFLENAFVEIIKHNTRDDLYIDGFDVSEWAIANAAENAKPFVTVAGIDDYVFSREYDVMVALDVFEHLTEEQATRFLRRSRPYIREAGFFAIALDEERQHGDASHVNLRDRAWWNSKLAECGWAIDWTAQMRTGLAMREHFIHDSKVEIFIAHPNVENDPYEPRPSDGKLFEMAMRKRWENKNAT